MDLTLRGGTGLFVLDGAVLNPDAPLAYIDFTSRPTAEKTMLVGNTDAMSKVPGAAFRGWVGLGGLAHQTISSRVTAGGAFQDVMFRLEVVTSFVYGGTGDLHLRLIADVGQSIAEMSLRLGFRVDYQDGSSENPVLFGDLPSNPLDITALVAEGHGGLDKVAFMYEYDSDPAHAVLFWYPPTSPLAPTRTEIVIYSPVGGIS